jgi:hypothetical protein
VAGARVVLRLSSISFTLSAAIETTQLIMSKLNQHNNHK